MVDEFARDRQLVRRKLGLESIPASLGDANGVIYTPGRPGFYEVRIATGLNSDGSPRFSQPASVRLKLGMSLTITPGAALWLNYDENNELVITGGNGAAQAQQGINPIQQNPLDPYMQGKVNQAEVLTLNSNPTTPPGTLVYVKAWPVIASGTMYVFPGGTIDLDSFIPAAGEHCICVIGIQGDYATLEAFASTAKATTDPIDLTDYQEALDGLSANTTPAWFYRLHDDQTEILDEDKWLDIRQMVNTASGGGSGDVVGPASATDNAIARYDGTTGKLLQNSATTIDDNGNLTNAGPVTIDGDTDAVQLLVQGNATQTALLAVFEDSGGNDQVTVTGAGGLHVNEAGNDADSHVEGDNDATLTYWDAGNNRLAVGTSAPDARFVIVGRADEVQLAVKGNATQNQPLVEFRNSASTVLHKVLGTGHIEPGADNTYNFGSPTAREAQIWGVSHLGNVHVTPVKNTSGATANANHVGYITYTAGSGAEYKTTTTANANVAWCVVVGGGANNADIYVATSGVVTVELNANCSAGDFLLTSTTAGRASVSTTMRPEVFAVALTANAGGAGGTCAARLYCNTVPQGLTNSNDTLRINSMSNSDFVATINGTPSGSTLVYNAPSSGNEDTINVSSSSQAGKLRLWNTTRSPVESLLISSVNTGTNTITFTSAVPVSWVNTDTITMRSQTATGAVEAGVYFYEIDLSGLSLPAMARGVQWNLSVTDTTAGGSYYVLLHPYTAVTGAFSVGDFISPVTPTNAFAVKAVPVMGIYGGHFVIAERASGSSTASIILRVRAVDVAVP